MMILLQFYCNQGAKFSTAWISKANESIKEREREHETCRLRRWARNRKEVSRKCRLDSIGKWESCELRASNSARDLASGAVSVSSWFRQEHEQLVGEVCSKQSRLARAQLVGRNQTAPVRAIDRFGTREIHLRLERAHNSRRASHPSAN